MRTERIRTDVLIIGGGTAGCFAAYVIGKKSGRKVLIAEKANIKRSGCLAAGVNALNAYITEGRVPQDYVDYAKKDGPWNRKRRPSSYHVKETESCDKGDGRSGAGHPEGRKRKICCQRKPKHQDQWRKYEAILAKAAAEQENVTVLNHVNITDYKTENKKVTGAVGFSVNEDIFYDIDAKAVLCATGGAAGLTDRIIRDFPDIRCGILRLTQVQDMQWDFFPVRR